MLPYLFIHFTLYIVMALEKNPKHPKQQELCTEHEKSAERWCAGHLVFD